MAEEENLTPVIVKEGVFNIQILNVVPQKVVQVDKPTGVLREQREDIDLYLLNISVLDSQRGRYPRQSDKGRVCSILLSR